MRAKLQIMHIPAHTFTPFCCKGAGGRIATSETGARRFASGVSAKFENVHSKLVPSVLITNRPGIQNRHDYIWIEWILSECDKVCNDHSRADTSPVV